ncbi:DUF6338 family protein [Bacillus thuringiensis]|uniref:DUF6338 family protein n=1 Tax=Bacillus thuringiensis TaxID=1428 RepID=UPI000BFA33F4|nr:DUF6338 family protein [Bacillus thuringiensis]PES34155.1 hypothetical protein CN493_21455 [Bacillus thuringiensis]
MQFSELTVRLLLIFFPGIISALIVDKLTLHRGREFKEFLLNSFLLGLSSYFLFYMIIGLNNLIAELRGLVPTWKLHFLMSLTDRKVPINITEVIIATFIAIILAFLISFSINHKFLHRFAIKMKLSSKFAQLDVWAYVFDSPDIDWITVRDIENDLMYQGWVEAFSDTHDTNELFLRDVIVYKNSTGEELYSVGAMYITGYSNKLILECPVSSNV